MILAGDVGGTKTLLGLFAPSPSGPVLVRQATLASRSFATLEDALEHFLAAGARPALEAVCVGVAGPVVEGRCVATNLPWVVEERRLAAALGAPRARLVNDLEAAAHGVLPLAPEARAVLQPGVERAGNVAVIAAGTGLGEALAVLDERGRWTIVASEGGHADFAPRSEVEDDLLRFLRKEFGRVSYERVLSGPGLVNLYRFVRDTGLAPGTPAVADRMGAGDPAAAVTDAATAGVDAAAVKAVALFASIYGAETGNLALKALALGGVVVAGGIAPRLLPRLADGAFVAAFRDKGRLGTLLATIPVHVALDPATGLLGAARCAARLL